MDKDVHRLLLRYRWCRDLGVCIGCEKSLKHGGVICSICQLFSYCSPACLENDVTHHRPACETILFIKGQENVIPDYLFTHVAKLTYRAKLLDSEGDFISPAVIREAYLIRNSGSILRKLATLLTEPRSDTRVDEDGEKHTQNKNHVSVTLGLHINSSSNREAASRPGVFQDHSSFRTEGGSFPFSVPNLGSGFFGRPPQVRTQGSMDTEDVQDTSDNIQGKLLKDKKQRIDGNSKRVLEDHATHSDRKKQREDCDKSQCSSNSGAENCVATDDHIVKGSQRSNINSCDKKPSGKLVPDKESKINKPQDTFGSGWWGKHKKISSKKSIQENKPKQAYSNKRGNDQESRCKKSSGNQDSSNATKDSATSGRGINSNINSRSSSSSQVRNESEPRTFGSGWWQGNILGNSKSATSPAAKTQSSQHSVPHECKQQDARSTSSVSALNNNSSNNSALSDNVSNNISNNSTCSNHAHSNSSTSKSTEKNGAKEKPESEDFGSGWWKHKNGRPKKAKSKTDQASSKMDRQMPKQQNNTDSSIVKRCRDVVPYQINVTPEQTVRFKKVASSIASRLVQEEATHGRLLVMGLIAVPGLWRASLGGSRISLVVEIVDRYPGLIPGIIIRDKHGHTAPVLLNTTESSYYDIPGTQGAVSVQISDCLKPGTFIVLRAVKWQELPNGKLIIIMWDMANVDFIFYEFIA